MTGILDDLGNATNIPIKKKKAMLKPSTKTSSIQWFDQHVWFKLLLVNHCADLGLTHNHTHTQAPTKQLVVQSATKPLTLSLKSY